MLANENQFQRHAARLASRLHEHLLGPAHARPLPPLPQATWQHLCRLYQHYEHVKRRGWNTSLNAVQRDVYYVAQSLTNHLNCLHSASRPDYTEALVASPRDIMGDLLALENEFDEVTIDFREGTLTAVTDSIVLGDIDFGSFRIVLRWSRIGQAHPYTAVASDPYRPESGSEVSHPHVREDVLCEGEGATAIRAALRSGRLLDFFTLVRQILETYNAESAFVTLDRWSGVACSDCAHNMSTESHGLCERCDAPLCEDCMSHCASCDEYVCSGCRNECSACGDSCCRGCLEFGPGADLGRYCPNCLKEQQPSGDDPDESTDDSSPKPQGESAATAADALRVGQAARAA